MSKNTSPPVVAWLCFSGGAYTAAECDNVPYHGDEPLVKLCDAEAQLFSVTALRDDLLAALKEVVAISDRKHDAWDRAHAAIANAEKTA